jgi:hypothetical protein
MIQRRKLDFQVISGFPQEQKMTTQTSTTTTTASNSQETRIEVTEEGTGKGGLR